MTRREAWALFSVGVAVAASSAWLDDLGAVRPFVLLAGLVLLATAVVALSMPDTQQTEAWVKAAETAAWTPQRRSDVVAWMLARWAFRDVVARAESMPVPPPADPAWGWDHRDPGPAMPPSIPPRPDGWVPTSWEQ